MMPGYSSRVATRNRSLADERVQGASFPIIAVESTPWFNSISGCVVNMGTKDMEPGSNKVFMTFFLFPLECGVFTTSTWYPD